MSKSWWCKFKIKKKIEQGAILKRQYWSQRHEQNWHGLPQLQWLAWLLVQDNFLLCACASTCLVRWMLTAFQHLFLCLQLLVTFILLISLLLTLLHLLSLFFPHQPPLQAHSYHQTFLPTSWSSKCKYVIIPYRLDVRLNQRHAFKVRTSYIITM